MINITPLLKASKSKGTESAPLYLRITLDKQRTEVSLKQRVPIKQWDNVKRELKGGSPLSHQINNLIQLKKTDIMKHHYGLQISGDDFDIHDLRQLVLGNKPKGKTLLEAVQYHNDNMKDLIGSQYAVGTYKRFVVTLGKLKRFIPFQYGKPDIYLSDITTSFAYDYEQFLKAEDGLGQNTANKHFKNLKKILNLAVSRNWLSNNPLSTVTFKAKPISIKYLTAEELDRIEKRLFSIDRLEEVRDFFLFCCVRRQQKVNL